MEKEMRGKLGSRWSVIFPMAWDSLVQISQGYRTDLRLPRGCQRNEILLMALCRRRAPRRVAVSLLVAMRGMMGNVEIAPQLPT